MSERTYTGQEIVERASAEDRWADAMLRYQVEMDAAGHGEADHER